MVAGRLPRSGPHLGEPRPRVVTIFGGDESRGVDDNLYSTIYGR